MELFAADGHDAGGCERVTGKSGMRPPEGWPLIDWLQVRRRGAAPLSRRTVRRRPRTRRRGFERRRRLQTHGASRSRRPHRRRPVPNHRTHPVPESATIWCWNTQATRRRTGVESRGGASPVGGSVAHPVLSQPGRRPIPVGTFPLPALRTRRADFRHRALQWNHAIRTRAPGRDQRTGLASGGTRLAPLHWPAGASSRLLTP